MILFAQVEEILNFTQEDLVSDDIMMLDLRSEVYVWVGRESNAQEKEMAFKTALEYVSTGMLNYIKYVRDASHFLFKNVVFGALLKNNQSPGVVFSANGDRYIKHARF